MHRTMPERIFVLGRVPQAIPEIIIEEVAEVEVVAGGITKGNFVVILGRVHKKISADILRKVSKKEVLKGIMRKNY